MRLASKTQGPSGAPPDVAGVEGKQVRFEEAARSDGDDGKGSLWESEAAAHAWAAFLARIAH